MNILVTGTSSGIGRAVAAHLLGAGHRVWGIARSAQTAPADAPAGAFRSSRCDASDWSAISRLAGEVGAEWGSLDGIVACAGVHGAVGPALEVDPAAWSATIRANLDATYFTLRAFHPLLRRASRRGKIVCFSGGGATKSRANFSAYAAAKTAIVRLVENIAEEEGSALDINAVAPGAIPTRLTDEIIALGAEGAGVQEYKSARKLKADGGAALAKAVGLVDWLLSPASDGITGRLLSAPWDPWAGLQEKAADLGRTDVYMLRRIVPSERGLSI